MSSEVELQQWLHKHGLEELTDAITGEGFDIESLRLVTEEDLKSIGINKVGLRKRLMSALVEDFGPAPKLTGPPSPAETAIAAMVSLKPSFTRGVEVVGALGKRGISNWKTMAAGVAALLLLVLLVWGAGRLLAGPQHFGEEFPLALKIADVRSVHHANQIAERLRRMELFPEILPTDDIESGGTWFRVIAGQSADAEELELKRKEFEEAHKLSGLEVIDYGIWKERIIEGSLGDFLGSEERLIKTAGATISPSLSQVIKKYPHSPDYFVDFVSVYNSPESPKDLKHYNIALGAIKTDLPRGIKRKALLKHSEAYCEAILKDTIHGDQVTVNVVKLKQQRIGLEAGEEDSGDLSSVLLRDPVKYYAQLILDSGVYRVERTEPMSVQADELLQGLVVTIEPKPNYTRSYALLTGADKRFVYMSQSTKKSAEEIRALLSLVGKSKGLLEYQEFHNSFEILPQNPKEGDRFTGYSMSKLGWDYAQNKGYREWAKQSVGRWITQAHYHTAKKGYWTLGTIDFVTPQAASENFRLQQADGRTKVRAYGTQGGMLSEERYSTRTYRPYKFPWEISIASNRLKVFINNGSKSHNGEQKRWAWGWLKEEALIERLEMLQLNRPGGFRGSP